MLTGIPVPDNDLQQVAALHDKGKRNKVNYEEFLRGTKYVGKVRPVLQQTRLTSMCM